MLKEHLKRFEKNLDLVLFPSAFLNGHRIRGNLGHRSFTTAVCEEFTDLPRICLDLIRSQEPHPHFIIFTKEFWVVLLGAVFVVLGAVLAVYKFFLEHKINENIQMNINQHITKYERINDNKHKYSNILGKDTELTPTESF